jgi:hypothetical protein
MQVGRAAAAEAANRGCEDELQKVRVAAQGLTSASSNYSALFVHEPFCYIPHIIDFAIFLLRPLSQRKIYKKCQFPSLDIGLNLSIHNFNVVKTDQQKLLRRHVKCGRLRKSKCILCHLGTLEQAGAPAKSAKAAATLRRKAARRK